MTYWNGFYLSTYFTAMKVNYTISHKNAKILQVMNNVF